MRRKKIMGTTVEQEIYYVDAIGTAATRIGSRMISPHMPPTEFTEEEYTQNKVRLDFYKDAGVISVAEPGTRKAVLKADAIKREKERLAEIYAGDSDDEPDPELLKRGFSVSEAYAEKQIASGNRRKPMPTFTAPAEHPEEEEVSYKCMALAKSGDRCKNDAMEDLLVCGIHRRMLKKGTEVKDANGRIISKDGKTFEG